MLQGVAWWKVCSVDGVRIDTFVFTSFRCFAEFHLWEKKTILPATNRHVSWEVANWFFFAVSHIQFPLNHLFKSTQIYLLINFPPKGWPVDFYILWSFAYKIFRMRIQFVTDETTFSLFPSRSWTAIQLSVPARRANPCNENRITFHFHIDTDRRNTRNECEFRAVGVYVLQIAYAIIYVERATDNHYSCCTRRNNLFYVVGKCSIGKPSSGRISIVWNGL